MNEMIAASFLRRLLAFLIDAMTLSTIWSFLYGAWALRTFGFVPATAEQFGAIMDAGIDVLPNLIVGGWIGYVALSWTPILGRRTVGMRQMGIQIVRDPR